MIRRLILLSTFICCVAFCSAEKKNAVIVDGSIKGVVVTQEGRPAAHFKVCTQVHSQESWLDKTETCCTAMTDDQGRFSTEHLGAGKYEVLATNESEGYSLENQSPGKNVTITPKKPHATVAVQLRTKGPLLWGTITDKRTGKAIEAFQIGFEGIDCEAGAGAYQRTDDYYYLPIPADCAGVITARARGYKGWVYTDSSNPSRPVLRLAAGERKRLDISLEPLPKELSKR